MCIWWPWLSMHHWIGRSNPCWLNDFRLTCWRYDDPSHDCTHSWYSSNGMGLFYCFLESDIQYLRVFFSDLAWSGDDCHLARRNSVGTSWIHFLVCIMVGRWCMASLFKLYLALWIYRQYRDRGFSSYFLCSRCHCWPRAINRWFSGSFRGVDRYLGFFVTYARVCS